MCTVVFYWEKMHAVNRNCYASYLKYVFRLEENVSRVMGQNLLTPKGEQNSLIEHFYLTS